MSFLDGFRPLSQLNFGLNLIPYNASMVLFHWWLLWAFIWYLECNKFQIRDIIKISCPNPTHVNWKPKWTRVGFGQDILIISRIWNLLHSKTSMNAHSNHQWKRTMDALYGIKLGPKFNCDKGLNPSRKDTYFKVKYHTLADVKIIEKE